LRLAHKLLLYKAGAVGGVFSDAQYCIARNIMLKHTNYSSSLCPVCCLCRICHKDFIHCSKHLNLSWTTVMMKLKTFWKYVSCHLMVVPKSEVKAVDDDDDLSPGEPPDVCGKLDVFTGRDDEDENQEQKGRESEDVEPTEDGTTRSETKRRKRETSKGRRKTKQRKASNRGMTTREDDIEECEGSRECNQGQIPK
jgi:hypothetical protein